jgi:hypothetical protein
MYPEPRQVALLLAVMITRAGKTRARISEKTIRVISSRTTLRDAFVGNVRVWLEEFGVQMVRLERGGFALIAIEALEGAPVILARNFIGNERRQLLSGDLDEDALYGELGIGRDSEDD